MIFTRGYKIKNLYVAKLARITKEEFIKGKSFLDSDIVYHTDFDGPIGIFTIKGKVAKRVSTDVDYYYFDGNKYPKIYEWYVKNVTPITQVYAFRDGVKAIPLKAIKELETCLNKEFEQKDQKEQKTQQENEKQ